jgi:hypothetical protein
MKWRVTSYEAEMKRLEKELAAEREVTHNTVVALGQQIIKLEDQLAAEREKKEEAEHQRDKWEQIAEELEHDRDKWQTK